MANIRKTGLKRLHMEAEEIAKNIAGIKEQIEVNKAQLRSRGTYTTSITRLQSQLKAQESRYNGILEKAENYGKGQNIFVVKVEVRHTLSTVSIGCIYYSEVELEEVDLLIARDFKGLDYRVLEVREITTGTIASL